MVGRGQSFYAGDGLNKTLVDPVEFEMVLQVAKAAGNGHTAPCPSAIVALFAALAACLRRYRDENNLAELYGSRANTRLTKVQKGAHYRASF